MIERWAILLNWHNRVTGCEQVILLKTNRHRFEVMISSNGDSFLKSGPFKEALPVWARPNGPVLVLGGVRTLAGWFVHFLAQFGNVKNTNLSIIHLMHILIAG